MAFIVTVCVWLAACHPAAADPQSVQAAFANLEQWLEGSPHAVGWHDYLNSPLLRQQLAEPQSADPRALAEVLGRYASGAEGLDHPRFVKVRSALEEWLAIISMPAGEHLQPVSESIQARFAEGIGGRRPPSRRRQIELKNRLQGLANELRQYADDPSTELGDSIGDTLNWLEARPEAASLVRAVRRYYGQPNVWIQISEELLGEAVGEPISEPTTVRDVILGTRIRGTGWVTGTTRLALEPGADPAVLKAIVSGRIDTATLGSNGPARMHIRSTTRFVSEKRLLLSEQGLRALPAGAAAHNSTQVVRVDSTLPRLLGRIVQRVAWRRIGQQDALAERIAARHAEPRIAQVVDRRADLAVQRLNRLALEPFLAPARRPGKIPDRIVFTSAEGYLRIGTFRGPLGVPSRPLDWSAGPAFSIRLHSTALDRIAVEGLAGTTLTDTQLGASMNRALGLVLFPEPSDQEAGGWSMTFSRDRPLALDLLTDGFAMTLRGSRFTADDQQYGGMDVRADYRLESGPQGPRLVRRAIELIAPDSQPAARGGASPRQAPLSGPAGDLVADWFSQLFTPELVAPRAALGDDGPQLGRLTRFTTAGDWLTIGWDAKADPAARTLPRRAVR